MRLSAIALTLSLLLSIWGCEKKETSLIDYNGAPPVLLQTSLSPTFINSDSINVGASRNPDDILPLSALVTAQITSSSDNPIISVSFVVSTPTDNQSIASGQLLDDGVAPDILKGDGIFSAKVAFQIKRVEIGVFKIAVSAEAQNGFQSNMAILPLTVYRGNQPPVLSDLEAPDTVKLGSQTQLLTFHVRANDPDGLLDVASVVFNSFKPDGTPSSGNPFQMYDDGSPNHGDDKAGDGIYSLIVTLPPTVQTGTYTFKFQAFDRSNAASNVLVWQITVKP